MSGFTRYLGIDYSGSGDPAAGNRGIQVFEADRRTAVQRVVRPGGGDWSRAALAEWLTGQLLEGNQAIVGIDHAFSFPRGKMDNCANWTDFLERFQKEWQTDKKAVTKAEIVRHYPDCGRLLRLTDQWTSSAKSVFGCNGPGVACSTFAGLPWLLRIREQCGDRVFFWPFDGWRPTAGKHVVAEVYPSLFHNRYRESGLKGDALDAYAVARWLKDMDGNGFLLRYFDPLLTAEQKELTRLEGWILGVA